MDSTTRTMIMNQLRSIVTSIPKTRASRIPFARGAEGRLQNCVRAGRNGNGMDPPHAGTPAWAIPGLEGGATRGDPRYAPGPAAGGQDSASDFALQGTQQEAVGIASSRAIGIG